jgi:UDP-4-amino-4,6-dideoxy-L-N-acetyl-beta-L-altrosamine transaminase
MIPFSPRKREREALETTTFVYDGAALEKLEAAVCAYHGCRFAVAFNTPESALTAALAAAGVGAHDTLVAGAMAPLHHYTAAAHLQAIMHYCDIGLDGNLYAKAVPDAISDRTKALLIASFEGIRAADPALPPFVLPIKDMTASLTPAETTGTSLWSLETLMPEGMEKTGFVLTDDADAAARMRLYRVQGREEGALWSFDLLMPGGDVQLDGLAATVALKQMDAIDAACTRRREHAETLDKALHGSSLFKPVGHGADDVLRSYPLLLTPALYCHKEDIFAALQAKGVEAAVCCKPVYKTSAYRDDGIRLQVTEDFYKALLQLPCHQRLDKAETDAVAAALLEAVETFTYRGRLF